MLEHTINTERPTWKLWCRGANGSLIDLSSGYSGFTGKVYQAPSTAVFTLTGTFTGAAGAGTEPDGTPNLTYTPATDEMTAVTPGLYRVRILAVLAAGGQEQVFDGDIRLLAAV